MGGFNSALGLLFEISADPSKAQLTTDQFAKSLEAIGKGPAVSAGVGIASGLKPADDAILSAQQSTRLLAQEFGLHLPRAVTGAIGEVLPSIASMGTLLLGVFAVKEVIAFGKEVVKLTDDFNEVARSEKAISEIGKEVNSQMEQRAKASREYARTQATLLIAQVAAQEAYVEQLRTADERAVKTGSSVAALTQAYHFWFGQSKDLTTAENDLAIAQKLRDTIVKILGEDEDKAHKKHAAGIKETSDRLAELLAKERDESETLVVADNKRRQALKTYQDEVRAIDQAIEAARRKKDFTVQMEQEATQARTLALQNYETRVAQIEDQEAEKHALRVKRQIDQAIAAREKEIQAAQNAAGRITAIEAGYFGQIDRFENQAMLRHLSHQQQVLQAEIATNKLRGSRAGDLRDQIIAIERQKTQTQAQEEIRRIQLNMQRTLAEIDNQYKTLISATRNETQKTALLRQQEAQRVQIMQAGEQQIREILKQTEQEWRDYSQAQENAANASILGNAMMVASQAASLLQTLGQRKAAAYVEMVMQTAAGFASLAARDFWGAAQHFLSAAEYGIIAQQSASTAGGGGGGGSVAGPSVISPGSLTPAQQAALLAPGAISKAGAASQSQTIHIEIKGAIYGGRAGLSELTNHIIDGINHATQTQDRKLVASHVINAPPVSRGRQ